MKICKFMTLTGALALALASCTDKNEPSAKAGEGNGTMVYTSLRLGIPSISGTGSRATEVTGPDKIDEANAEDTYAGSAEDQKINGVRVVFYKDNAVYKYYDLDIKTDGSNTHNVTGEEDLAKEQNQPVHTVTNFTTKALELKKDSYKVLVFINPKDYVKERTVQGKSFKDLVDPANNVYNSTAELTSALTQGGIQMANVKGLIDVTNNFKPNKDAAEKNPVQVKVERAVAKVFVNKAREFAVKYGTQASDAKDIKWGIMVENKKTFSIRQFANYAPNFLSGRMEDATEPSGANRWNRYATDPNFKEMSLWGRLDNDFNYNVRTLTTTPTFQLNTTGYNDNQGQYVVENTMEAAGQYQNQSTMVVAEISYVPEAISKTEIPSNDATWYSFKSTFITKAKFDDYLRKIKADNDNKLTDATLGCPDGFIEYIKTKVTTGENALPTDQSFMVDADGNVAVFNDGLMKEYNKADGRTTETDQFTRRPVLQCYYHGVNYYNIPIRHFDPDNQQTTVMGYGRFGVVRNNAYKVELSQVVGPGNAIPYVPTVNPKDPKKPDPQKGEVTPPDESEKEFIAANVSVEPMMVRMHSYIVGDQD